MVIGELGASNVARPAASTVGVGEYSDTKPWLTAHKPCILEGVVEVNPMGIPSGPSLSVAPTSFRVRVLRMVVSRVFLTRRLTEVAFRLDEETLSVGVGECWA